MKSYPALAIAQYVAGSEALKSVPPVSFAPCCIFSRTGFQTCDDGGGLNAGPYFHVAGLKGPWLIAPVGATARALLSFPPGAARGKAVVPAAALLRYGSAVGAGCVCWP